MASGSANKGKGVKGKGRYHATSSLARAICPASPDSPVKAAVATDEAEYIEAEGKGEYMEGFGATDAEGAAEAGVPLYT